MRKFLVTSMVGGVMAAGALLMPANAAGVAAGTCTTSAQPTPPAGATTAPIPPDGTAYAGGSQTAGAVGAEGSHGWIQGSGGTTSGSGTIAGYSTDPGNVNGSVTIGSSPSACAGAGGQKVSAP